MAYKSFRLCLMCLFAACLTQSVASQHATTGRVGLGIFVPRGDDSEVAKTSFVLQMTGDVQIQDNWGVESEFSWTPINLDTESLPAGQINEARQLTGLIGFRLSSSQLSQANGAPSAYLSARIGISRIAVRSDAASSISGWIGRTVDATQNLPSFSFPIRATENAFVISPRAGFLIPTSGKALIDISFTPHFLFDAGKVTTQFYATIGFGLLGSLD